jgi:hypothetical protein
MSEEQLRAGVATVNIYARVLPEQKFRLVEAFKANGEIVGGSGCSRDQFHNVDFGKPCSDLGEPVTNADDPGNDSVEKHAALGRYSRRAESSRPRAVRSFNSRSVPVFHASSDRSRRLRKPGAVERDRDRSSETDNSGTEY